MAAHALHLDLKLSAWRAQPKCALKLHQPAKGGAWMGGVWHGQIEISGADISSKNPCFAGQKQKSSEISSPEIPKFKA